VHKYPFQGTGNEGCFLDLAIDSMNIVNNINKLDGKKKVSSNFEVSCIKFDSIISLSWVNDSFFVHIYIYIYIYIYIISLILIYLLSLILIYILSLILSYIYIYIYIDRYIDISWVNWNSLFSYHLIY
jgi:hypothetical protein